MYAAGGGCAMLNRALVAVAVAALAVYIFSNDFPTVEYHALTERLHFDPARDGNVVSRLLTGRILSAKEQLELECQCGAKQCPLRTQELSNSRKKALLSVSMVPLFDVRASECKLAEWAVFKAAQPNPHYRPYSVSPWEGGISGSKGSRAAAASDQSNATELYGRASDWPLYQGTMEVMGYALDRVLELNMKPATALRALTDEEKLTLAENSNAQLPPEERAERLDTLEHLSLVSVQPYCHGVEQMAPTEAGMRVLRDPSLRIRASDDADALAHESKLLSWSDQLVLDYLLDDHDRNVVKNWVRVAPGFSGQNVNTGMVHGEHGGFISLDSGGAFFWGDKHIDHKGRDWSEGILCGRFPTGSDFPQLWNDYRDGHFRKRHRCERITVYRQSTILALFRLSAAGDLPDRMASQMKLAVQGDIYPARAANACASMVYENSVSREHVHFNDCEIFLSSIAVRARMLLQMVSEDTKVWGERSIVVNL